MASKAGVRDSAQRVRDPRIPRVYGIVLAGTYPRYHSALDQLSPRPLLPVAERPLISYSLRWLGGGGLQDVTICVNSAARALREHLDTAGLGLRLSYLEDWTPRGAAGCVRDAAARTDAGTFVVADGTTVPLVELRELLAAHAQSTAALTVVVGPERPRNGRLRPTGIYVFDRSVLGYIPEEGFQDLKETLIPSLYRAGERVATYSAPGISPRVVDNDSYLALNHWAVERTASSAGAWDGFRVAGQARVHDSAAVDPNARLLGPIVLGPDVSVQSGATVIGPASIGPGSTVGRDAVVSRSVVWSKCLIGDGAFVDRCMLADEAVVSSWTSLYSTIKIPGRRRGARDAQVAELPSMAPSAPVVPWLRPSAAGPR